MKALVTTILLFIGIGCVSAQKIEDATFFQMRMGDWSGKTTITFPSKKIKLTGTDQNKCQYILKKSFIEISGTTDAFGETKHYRWIYRPGEKRNEFLYTYLDSRGNYAEGSATFDPESKTLTVIAIGKAKNRKSITTSRFLDADTLEIKYTFTESDGTILYSGSADYKKKNT